MAQAADGWSIVRFVDPTSPVCHAGAARRRLGMRLCGQLDRVVSGKDSINAAMLQVGLEGLDIDHF